MERETTIKELDELLADGATQTATASTSTATSDTTDRANDSPAIFTAENLAATLELAAAGLPVFPARVVLNVATGRWIKRPCIKGWQADATTNTSAIEHWWRQFPDAVPGIELGRAQLVVIDSDRHGGPDGVAALSLLAADHGGLPAGPVSETPGNGEHHIYLQPLGQPFGNRRGALPGGIDVRGNGGWIAGPGSVRPDGRRWQAKLGTPLLGDAFANGKLEKLPSWLANIIRAARPPSFSSFSDFSDGARQKQSSIEREVIYARRALEAAASELARMPPHSGRNQALNGSAYHMGRMAARGWIDRSEVADELWRACITNGLAAEDGADRIQATLASGLIAGMQKPAEDLRDRRNTSGGKEGTSTLCDPLPLARSLPPAEPYPVDSLGADLAAAARAFQAKTQAPMAICANAVLAVACLAAQAHADIELPTGEVKPVSLFLVTIARSGERKTSNDNLALTPVKTRESELRVDHDAAAIEHENALAAWEAERKHILQNKKKSFEARKDELDQLGPQPKPPLLPIIVCHEPTFEGLARLLINGQPSIGIFASEGGVFIGGHGFSEDAKLRTAAGLSLLWDDGRLTRVRAGDGAVALAGRRVSMHLQAQPDVAARLFSDPMLVDQGLLSRILVLAPESTQGQRFWRDVAGDHNQAAQKYVARLNELFRRPMPLKEGTRNELSPRMLRLSAEARAIWTTFHDEVERELPPGGLYEAIAGFAAKLPEHAARIAAVLAMYGDPNATEVDARALSNGITLSRHYASTALRVHGASSVNAELLDAEALLKWIRLRSDRGLISLPDVVQTGPNRIRETATAKRLLALLEQHRRIARVSGSVTVNGKLRQDVWRLIEGGYA